MVVLLLCCDRVGGDVGSDATKFQWHPERPTGGPPPHNRHKYVCGVFFALKDLCFIVLFLGVFSTGLSVLLWLHGAKRLGVTTAGLHQNLVPAFVMLIMFILGEGFQWREGVGGLLVISGAIIAQLLKRESICNLP